MSNILLAWDNALDDGAASWSAASGDASRLAERALSRRWIANAVAGNASFSVTPYGAPSIAMVALCSHSMTLSATVRVRGYNGGGGTIYDSGTISAWASGVTEASRRGLRWNFIHRLSAATAAASWLVEVTDAANADFYVGRLMLARKVWQPAVNLLFGGGLGFESNSEAQRAQSGAEWFVDSEAHRITKFKLDRLSSTEAFDFAFDLARCAAGSNREVILQYDPADTVHSVRRSMFGRLRQLAMLDELLVNAFGTAYEVKELL